jgi:hypothetical protein
VYGVAVDDQTVVTFAHVCHRMARPDGIESFERPIKALSTMKSCVLRSEQKLDHG